MKNKFSKFINLQGKYLTSLLFVLFFAVGQMWAEETVLFSSFTNTTASNYFKSYTVDSKTVTVATDKSISSSSGDYFVQLGSTPSNNASNYVELSVSSATIKTVSVLITGNGSNKTCQPALLGWEGAIADNTTADYVLVPTSRSVSNKGLNNAEWHQFDVHGNDLTKVRIYRAVKGVSVAGADAQTYGNGQTLQFYGIRVELEGGGTTTTYTVTLNPGEGAYSSAPTGWTADGNNIKKTVSAGALTIPEPTRAGYKLTGWKSGLTDVTLSAGKLSVTQDTTLTAQWAEADCKIYSLTGAIGSAELTAGEGSVSASALVLSNSAARIKLTPASGETFKSGDVITISGAPGNTAKKFSAYVYAANGSTKLATLTVANAGDLPLLSGTLSGDAEYVFLARIDGTTQNIYTCEVHRSCAEGAAAGLSYATAALNKMTGDAAFTNPLTNTNGLYVAGYSSSNTAVATVASNGAVTIVGDGSATITAHSAVQTKAGVLYAAGTATYTVTVTSADDDATLSALSVTGLTLSPAFASETEDYTVTKAYGAADPAVADVTATATSSEANAEVVWDGTNKKFVITVTAGDNTTQKVYNITVNEAPAPKSLSRVLFSNGFDAFIDNANHTVKAYYLAGQAAPTATTITAGAGTAGEYAEGKITVTGADASTVDYIVTLAEVTPNTTTVAEEAAAGEFAGDEAWVKNGLLVYGNAAGYSAGDKWYVNRRLTKGSDPEDDQRVIAGWVRSYFFVGNASKFIMTVGGNNALKYAIDGGEYTEVNVETLEIALTKGNHMIEIVSNQSNGDCRLSAPKLVELPPTFTVTYKAGEGTGDDVEDDEATIVADVPGSFTAPEGKIFHSWKDALNNDVAVGDPVTADMTLTAQWIAHYAVTFNMQGHGADIVAQDIVHGSKAVEPADPSEIGFDFGGWFTDAECTAGNEFDFNTAITAATELFAKWTAFDGCAVLVPALSGDAPTAKNQAIDLQSGSFGGAIKTAGAKDNKWSDSFAYTANGFGLQKGGADSLRVELSNDMKVGTVIKVKFYAADASSRGLYLKNLSKTTKMEMTQTEVGAKEYTYTVEEGDGLAGTNAFLLSRNNTVYLQSVMVSNCGAAIVYHNLTSAVDPAGKGTVTLGASSVREGYSTTATYSDIDPLYEFVSWEVSGEGATLSSTTANPVTVTMGTADAVVTLNLQLIPVKFTVNYYDGETPMGTEEVAVNENPTASEIDTDKRHYTFQGWAETDGGSVVALNTITSDVAATINLYAVYAPVACPTEGTVFSMEFDNTKTPTSTVKVAKNGGSLDLADYATLVGGNAVIENTETSDKDAISTDGKFKLTATKEVMKIELECAIATGDVIRIPDNNAKYVLSTSNAKTGTYQAQTSSQHEFEATAAWNGVDDLYILYDGSSLNFTKVYVLRPYTISFDLQGHGDAIDAQKLVAGKKVEEPAAPTADGWDFGGWYKEAACTNAWDFDNDVVEGSISIYAKWSEHVTNDATLKSLKYGSTAITLEDGIYTYNVELAAAVAAVPALSAETNADLANALITNAEAFVAGQATSTVLVTAEDGATQLLYTVNFTKAAAIELVDVTGDMFWDFSKANDGSAATSSMCNDEVLANVVGIVNNSDFKSDNIKATANKFSSNKLQASMIKFHTTVDGMITVVFSNTDNKSSERYLTVNGRKTDKGSKTKTAVTYTGFVYAGDVELGVVEGDGNMLNFTSVDFKATVDYPRTVNPSYLGTLCWTNNAVLGGATLYEFAGKNEYNYLVFDEVPENRLEAGKPYIFMPENGNTEIKVYNTDNEDALTEDQAPVNHMYGTITGKTLVPGQDDNMYYFSASHIWAVKDFTVEITIPAYYCYVDYQAVLAGTPAAAPAPGRRRVTMGVQGEQVATGMEQITNDQLPIKVLINGQLFILRGEKMFNANGQLVK